MLGFVFERRSKMRFSRRGIEQLLSMHKTLSLTSSTEKQIKPKFCHYIGLKNKDFFKDEKFPLIVRLLWVCGCVATISESKLKWNFENLPARRIVSLQNTLKSHGIHRWNITKTWGYPNICDLKPSSHNTGYASRCLKFSINYTQAFISTLPHWLSLIHSLPLTKPH